MPGLFSFLPYPLPTRPSPLSRFLPPLPEGLVTSWLSQDLPKGSLVLDPFGSPPSLAVELAQAGYRVLVAAHNPIERFLLELAATPPTQEALQAVLADLSVSLLGGERLETHIRSLYTTECANCGREISVDSFIWEQDTGEPSLIQYRCPYCDEHGEHPLSQADLDRSAQFKRSGLHWSRAIERVAPLDDPDRQHAEEALEIYSPRAVYALITLINKIDSLPNYQLRPARALLLAALDQTDLLWSHPTTRDRPRQLKVSHHSREKNVWLALEEAASEWKAVSSRSSAVPFVVWPESPPSEGGICLYPGPLRDLVNELENPPSNMLPIQAVIGALPRPNQAYWTLSALWAGWLWGPSATAPFKSVLRRRRYDWSWHCNALYAAYHNLSRILKAGTSVWGYIGEVEPGFIGSALIAGETAGIDLVGLGIREGSDQTHILWRLRSQGGTRSSGAFFQPGGIEKMLSEAITVHLQKRQEPTSFLTLFAAALAGLVQSHGLALTDPPAPSELFSQFQDGFNRAIADLSSFIRFGATERSADTGKWWLRHPAALDVKQPIENGLSLADRTEIAVVNYLIKTPGCNLEQLDRAVCQEFEGLFSPDLELVTGCLRSYGESDVHGNDQWQLRSQDAPSVRRGDLVAIVELVEGIGSSLGYQIRNPGKEEWDVTSSGRTPIFWVEDSGKTAYTFYIIASAAFSHLLVVEAGNRLQGIPSNEDIPGHKIIVVPGGRAALVLFKLERDPHLKQAVESGWRFMKYRLLHRLAESDHLSRLNFESLLDLDPLAYEDPQLPLI